MAPPWAQRPWFSDLLQLSLAPPVFLRPVKVSCACPRSRHLSPDLSRLRLHAWRLSSDFPRAAGFLLRSGGAVFAGAPSILARSISGAMVHFIVSSITTMAILSLVPTLAKVADFLYWLRSTRGLSVFLPEWLPFSVICGVSFSPSILVFGSGDSGSVTLLPTLFGGACAASPCLGTCLRC